LREIKSRFVHAFLPHGAWVHAAVEGLLGFPCTVSGHLPQVLAEAIFMPDVPGRGVAETWPSGLW
jgi:hypothetical protein